MTKSAAQLNLSGAGISEFPVWTESAAARHGFTTRVGESLRPNWLVCWAFYFSAFTIPFTNIYLPGTGGTVGVLRIAQVLIMCGVLSQPRVCLRWVPTALFWFLGYIGMRIAWGLWFTPQMSDSWWPDDRQFIALLGWLWVAFNLLQFPDARRGGLWALGLGCALCAAFHIAGIGVTEVANGEERSSVFGLNANELGITYAIAAIALLGLWMLPPRTWSQRFLPFPLIAVIGIAMAKTGSRSAILILILGVLMLMFFGKAFGSKIRRVASLVLLGAVVTVILWQIPTIMQRFREINPQNLGQDNPRARMAPVLWEMFLRSPVYGLGPDGYEWELTRRAMPYLIKEQKLIVSHNLILMLLVETGIIGLALFACGLKPALMSAWQARLKPCGPLPLALLLPLVIGAATVCHPNLYLVFWFAFAYALAGAA